MASRFDEPLFEPVSSAHFESPWNTTSTNPNGNTMDSSPEAVVSENKESTPEDPEKSDDRDRPSEGNTPDHLQSLTDTALDFLSTSSNGTIAGVSVFLIFAAFIVFGRVGLLLLGVFLGIILHASWEGTRNDAERKKVLVSEVSRGLLDWPRQDSVGVDERHAKVRPKTPDGNLEVDFDYSTFPPAAAAALRSLTDATIDNYVKYWYEPILPSESTFPLSCRKVLTDFLTSVSLHVSRKRTADSFLQFLTNSSSIVIVFLNEISEAFETTSHSPMSPEDTIRQYLKNFPESNLANVLEIRQQRKKLKMAADDILSNFLDPNASECSILRTFLREMCAGAVFESIVSSLSRPEFINSWIIYLLKEGESEIMSAIDAGVEGARNQGVAVPGSSNDMSNQAFELGRNTPETTKEERKITDKATEDAALEARRLSDMIAAQDTLRQNSLQVSHDHHRSSTTSSDNGTAIMQPSPTVVDPVSSGTQNENNCTGKVSNTNNLVPDEMSKSVNTSHSLTLSVFSESESQSKATTQAQSTTLCGASVLVDDGSMPEERGLIRSKPISEYLLQVEPPSSGRSGWMVFRKYADFESLHATLGTISRLNRIRGFSEQYPNLPSWKGKTKFMLARSLERYLQDALQHECLAESGRMRRFFEKDESVTDASVGTPARSGIPLPSQNAFENVGKSVLGVLTNAPKGMAGGSRAVLDGVTGVFGNVASTNKKSLSQDSDSRERVPEIPLARSHTTSSELDKSSKDYPLPLSSHERQHSFAGDSLDFVGSSQEKQPSDRNGNTSSEVLHKADTPDVAFSDTDLEEDHGHPNDCAETEREERTRPWSPSPKTNSQDSGRPSSGLDTARVQSSPITHEETQIAVELMFAVINESYSLSSAWNIRRTLLNAAKSYILRPGSPNVETIRTLLQDSMIDAHTSDEAIGGYLRKLRENALPTEAEHDSWPPSPSEAEKEYLRKTARKLFVQRGMPQAVMSVMGAAASREALEKIFDCFQVEIIARGFAFSLFLQAMKVVIL